ncbi:hypothetical protein BDV35DRAFT_9713 [Aspergillus flavus]|uniref:Uncharacterized protein n=1 Tax=Aspergillus flavus TaxID=5059 RepID=A0A5N6HA25_ASPFL|nr:hypothetical protein BDV35DRAFT_9713 [Aspergillus flavus]
MASRWSLSRTKDNSNSSQHANQQKQAKELPDQACLAFSIDLLDYILKGDFFECTLVGCPAVLGIDFQHQTFHIAKRPISQGCRKWPRLWWPCKGLPC